MGSTLSFLLDEHISPRLAPRLHAKGVAATAAVHCGLAGATDEELWQRAFDESEIVITINAGDFIALARTADLHAGVIVLRSHGLTPDEQWKWIEPVVDWLLEQGEDLVNRVVEVHDVDKFSIRDIPPR